MALRTRIVAMHSSCRINFYTNRENLLLPRTLTHVPRRVCARFRLFSWYSSSHFPLCSFHCEVRLSGFPSYSGNRTHRQIHTRLSTACFRVSQPVGWHWGEFAAQYIYRIKPTLRLLFGDFCIGALANASGGSSHRHRYVEQSRGNRKPIRHIGVPSPLRSRLSVFVNSSW